MTAASGAAIVGVGVVRSTPEDEPKPTAVGTLSIAARRAMSDAGIDRANVGMLLTGRAPAADPLPQINMRVLNELKIAPQYSTEITVHGAGALAMLQYAALALNAGVVDYAVCVSGNVSNLWMDVFASNSADEADPEFEAPYAPTTVSLYAQVAQRFFHERKVTAMDCAKIAVECRKWALEHPWAAMRDKGPISIDDVLTSPMISSPLRRLDCAPYYPGAITVAVVLTSIQNARRHEKPIFVKGWGQLSTHEYLTERLGLQLEGIFDDKSFFPTGARSAASQAYEMASIGPADVDVVETSAPFTFLAALLLEELGFAAEGEVAHFINRGGIDRDRGLAFNTSGGNLSFGQSGQGLYLLLEAVEQLRRQARGRQVPDPNIALVHGHGGVLSSNAVVILST